MYDFRHKVQGASNQIPPRTRFELNRALPDGLPPEQPSDEGAAGGALSGRALEESSRVRVSEDESRAPRTKAVAEGATG